jgi:hypothetical protein
MKTSQTFKKIIPILIRCQKLIKPIPKRGENPHFKSDYAEYDDVIEEIKKVLNANDIWISHPTHFNEAGHLIMETIFLHTSGEWVSTELPVINKVGTDQGLGSSLTYTKRYSVLALAAVGTADDDGNAATTAEVLGGKIPSLKDSNNSASDRFNRVGHDSNQHSTALVTEPQIKRLFAIANKHNWSTDKVKEFMKLRFKIESTKELTKFNYDYLIRSIEGTLLEKGT